MEHPLDVLTAHAQQQPDAVAVIVDDPGGHEGPRTSFRELNEIATRLANALLARIEPGERIAWCGPNSLEVLAINHAARKAGVTAVPIPYRFTVEEMAYLIENSEARLVLIDAEYAPRLDEIRRHLDSVCDVVVWGESAPGTSTPWAEFLEGHLPVDPTVDGRSETGAQMIYTSGTTGRPKGALRTRSDKTIVAAMLRILGLGSEREVYLTSGPMYHSGPLAFAQINHSLGNPVVVARAFDPAQWLRAMTRYGVTNTFTAPTQLKRIVSLDASTLDQANWSTLRCVIANAAPVPYALKQEIVERLYTEEQRADLSKGWLFEVYGSTELGIAAILEPADQLRKPGSCGRPYGGIEIRIVGEDGSERPAGEPGELFIRTGLEMDGYHRTDDQLERVGNDWKSVGDVAFIDDEGYLSICDRKKDMIISGGVNIYPAEIEAAIHAHPAVLDVAVLGVPDDEWGERVHAIVQWRPGSTATTSDLEQLVAAKLAAYKRPRSWEVRDGLPRTESGKLLKRVLREELWAGRDRNV